MFRVGLAFGIAMLCVALSGMASSKAALPEVPVRLTPLDLSSSLSTEAIMAAGQLGGPLIPTYPPEDHPAAREINLSFATAMQAWNRHEYASAVALLRQTQWSVL
jgi:hypothetical protein